METTQGTKKVSYIFAATLIHVRLNKDNTGNHKNLFGLATLIVLFHQLIRKGGP
jgi:hypothetical protein